MDINLLKYNRHWEKDFHYPYPKKRKAFGSIMPFLNKHQIIEIVGLRRVGKSTLILQLINHLIEDSTDPFHILYFTFDEDQPEIETLLETYMVQSGLNYKTEKIYVFLDEIQKLPNFQNQIKVYYDLYPNIKFIISGSTSLFIKKKSQESLAGRIFSFILNPLSFDEYLMFKEKEEMLIKPRLYQMELGREFEIFLRSQFIESIFLKSLAEKKEYFSSIIKKIVFEDLPSVFKFENPQIIFRMVQYLAQRPGAIINNLNLATEFGINNKTVALYLSYLEDAFLIKKLYNFSKNLISSEKKLKKYYLASPSFSFALVDFIDFGALVENYIISISNISYFYRDVYGHEIDFIFVDEQGKLFPAEVKFKKKIEREDIKNLLPFMRKFALTSGFLIAQVTGGQKMKFERKIINIIPCYEFKQASLILPKQ